jgi:branched-chain amino acid transport system permease protein
MNLLKSFQKNRTLYLTLFALALMLLLAIRGLETKDWVITLLRGLSVGSITFLVAAGFSLIFGLMDVLNMAHGTLFMIGAYVGWTVVVRPDTFVDILPLALLFVGGFMLSGVWRVLFHRLNLHLNLRRALPWIGVVVTIVVAYFSLSGYPITKWDPGVYANSPVTNAFEASQGVFQLPAAKPFAEGVSPVVVLIGIFLAGFLLAFTVIAFGQVRTKGTDQPPTFTWKNGLIILAFVVAGLLIHQYNTPLTEGLFALDRTWLFLLAMVVAVLTGAILGGLMEITLIRPLYERPTYQLMLTLGLSSIGIEVTRSIWGLQEFTMPRPSIFDSQGEGCPAQSIGDLFRFKCATIEILGGRVRAYNEIFVPILGILILVAVWILLQRTRLGMIVRAGVQDREMVEALGINVRRVFTTIFALGVGLAAMGGVVGAPSTGLTTNLGVSLILNVLIALAIGGLTSYPGAALGSLIVGMLQQFIVKYGQIGINLPFLDEPFKPTPPIVPAATLLMMVVILLVMPNGLLGRRE